MGGGGGGGGAATCMGDHGREPLVYHGVGGGSLGKMWGSGHFKNICHHGFCKISNLGPYFPKAGVIMMS